MIEIGDNRVYYPEFENNFFTIIRNSVLESKTSLGAVTKNNYKSTYILLNKSNGSFTEIKSYSDDFIGQLQNGDGSEINFPSFLPNNKLYVAYNAVDLLNKEFDNQEKQEILASIYNQIQIIQKNIKETDNPVLLIGSIKKL